MNKTPKIILGISGTNGAGKDSVGEDLAKRHNFMFISVTEILRDELRRRDVAVERKHLSALSAEWRREYGMGILIDKAIAIYNDAGGDGKYDGLVLSSLRNTHETDHLHSLGGKQVWVDADPRVRFDRIQSNKADRNRSGEDDVSFEQFLADEKRESEHEGDAATLNMAHIEPLADIMLINQGTYEEFQAKVDKIVSEISKAV